MIGARVTDSAALAARTPAELSSYLRARGWNLASRTATAAIWTREVNGDEAEILQPLDQRLRDYARRVSDALAMFAAIEGRSELEILRDISASTWDVHTLSLFPADEPAGMISIEDGVVAAESLRSLVSAAAYPVFSRQQRAVQPARKPEGLADYLRNVPIGAAVEGSYVLTVFTPVPPRLSDQPTQFGEPGAAHEEEPVERQVSLAMY